MRHSVVEKQLLAFSELEHGSTALDRIFETPSELHRILFASYIPHWASCLEFWGGRFQVMVKVPVATTKNVQLTLFSE